MSAVGVVLDLTGAVLSFVAAIAVLYKLYSNWNNSWKIPKNFDYFIIQSNTFLTTVGVCIIFMTLPRGLLPPAPWQLYVIIRFGISNTCTSISTLHMTYVLTRAEYILKKMSPNVSMPSWVLHIYYGLYILLFSANVGSTLWALTANDYRAKSVGSIVIGFGLVVTFALWESACVTLIMNCNHVISTRKMPLEEAKSQNLECITMEERSACSVKSSKKAKIRASERKMEEALRKLYAYSILGGIVILSGALISALNAKRSLESSETVDEFLRNSFSNGRIGIGETIGHYVFLLFGFLTIYCTWAGADTRQQGLNKS